MRIIALSVILIFSYLVIEPAIAFVTNYYWSNPDYYFYSSGQATFFYLFFFNLIVAAFISWSIFYDKIELGFYLIIPIGLLLLVFMMFTWTSVTDYGHGIVKSTRYTDTFEEYLGYYFFTLVQLMPYLVSGKHRKKMVSTSMLVFSIAIIVYALCNYLSYVGVNSIYNGTLFYDNFKYRLSVLRLRYYSDMFLLVYGFYKLELLRKADKTLQAV